MAVMAVTAAVEICKGSHSIMQAALPIFVPPAWLPTQRNGRLLVFDECCYYIKTKTAIMVDIFGEGEELYPNDVYLLKLQCSGKLCNCTAQCHYNETTDMYINFELIGTHIAADCPWNLVGICKEFFMNEVYAKLKDRTFDTVHDSYESARSRFLEFYPTLGGEFEAITYFKPKGNKIIRTRYPPIPDMADLPEVVIPPDLVTTLRGNGDGPSSLLLKHSFLHPADTTHQARVETIIVLGTPDSFQSLCDGLSLFADGTFKVCPPPFYQLFIMYTSFGNWMKPCLYCLLPRKTELTYTVLFSALKEMATARGHEFKCETARTDFENGLMNSIRHNFDGIHVMGCFFHLCSAIYKKAMELDLRDAYKNVVTDVKLTIRMCMALAFLPANAIVAGFNEIREWYHALPAPPVPLLRTNLGPFFAYMQTNWIEGRVASPDCWSVYDEPRRRTNNDLEGYNSHLKQRLGKSLSLWVFLKKMKAEEAYIYNKEVRFARLMPLQSSAAVQMNNRLAQYKGMYNTGEMTTMQYLSSCTAAIADRDKK